MNETFLNQLREIFREDFRNQDYCIGQECVEKLFRKLLNELEPEIDYSQPSANASQILSAQLELMGPKLKKVFAKDDMFYQKLFKK